MVGGRGGEGASEQGKPKGDRRTIRVIRGWLGKTKPQFKKKLLENYYDTTAKSTGSVTHTREGKLTVPKSVGVWKENKLSIN